MAADITRFQWKVFDTGSKLQYRPSISLTLTRFLLEHNQRRISDDGYYNDVNNQQDAAMFTFINLFKSALHVSGDKFAHPQEHFLTVYTALVQCTDTAADQCRGTGRQQCRCIVPKAVYTVKNCSWGWANLSPETCRADLKGLINEKVLHLVGYLHRCTKMMHCHTNMKTDTTAPPRSNFGPISENYVPWHTDNGVKYSTKWTTIIRNANFINPCSQIF